MRGLALIDALTDVLSADDPRIVRWVGDDAAVVRARGYLVTSVDAVVDGVHFRRAQLTASEIGHRALGSALSDLAAMAAEPGEAYLTLGAPDDLGHDEALALMSGAAELAARHDVTIAGGDVTTSPTLTVSVTVIGWAEDPGVLVGRDGAGPDEVVAVTGALGGAGAGLAMLDGRCPEPPPAIAQRLHARYARPEPRFAAGHALSTLGASAMIDVSDGLATDARHLARRSGVRIELELAALPRDVGVDEVAEGLGVDPARLAATAGEDYELCACVPAGAWARLRGTWDESALGPLTPIGRTSAGAAELSFTGADGELTGFEHRAGSPNAE